MPHTLKQQDARRYRPSATRRPSGLSPIIEQVENILKKLNKMNGGVKKGRFTVYNVK